MADIFFATNRNYDSNLRFRFGDKPTTKESGVDLRFGMALVNGDTFETQVVDVSDEDTEATPKVYGSRETLGFLRERMKTEKTDTLIFIHGFNNSFAESLETSAKLMINQFAANGRDINVLLFAWPSDGLRPMPRYTAFVVDRPGRR